MAVFDDLFGTLLSSFRLGLNGVRLKNNAGNLQVRNTGDTAFSSVETSTVNVTNDSLVVNSDAANTGSDRSLTLSRNVTATQSFTLVFPPAKGTDGHVLRQKSGTAADVIELEMGPAGNTAPCITVNQTTLAFNATSPVALFNSPNGSIIDKIHITIDTAFNGTPTVSIGIAGQTAKYVGATALNGLLTSEGLIFRPNLPSTAGESLIATYSAGGATAGSARILVFYAVPS